MRFHNKLTKEKIARRAKKHGYHNWLRRRFHTGQIVRRSVIIEAPSIFSFSRNYEATAGCLHQLKCAALHPPKDKRVRRYVSIDFATIKEISTAAALILSAEIYRWKKIKRVPLRPRNIGKWDPAVKRLLVEIGFFDLLEVGRPALIESEDPQRDVTLLPLVTGNTLDRPKLALIEDHLREIARAFEQEPSIYMALTEAAYNTIRHGYPDGYEFKFPTLKDQWWATGSWSPASSKVRLILYDQGVGIAETLPTWDHWEDLTKWLSSKHPLLSQVFKEHANMIEAALEVSRTSLTSGHGQGLKDVVSPVDQLGGGSVRILSGKGQVLYEFGGKIAKIEMSQHLGGTLIEWTIPVP
ncbi:hypothetical protein [Marinovum algicola]|uniref:hypothetical protein n=1 Tax=Marinovum algicola TaxID=42444 RepID=UPI003B526AD8